MAQIKLPATLRDDARVARMAATLGVTRQHVIGLVYSLQFIVQASGPRVGTPAELDEMIGQPGFAAALPDDWYAIEDGQIVMQSSRKPSQGAGAGSRTEYMRRYRAAKRAEAVTEHVTATVTETVTGVTCNSYTDSYSSATDKQQGVQPTQTASGEMSKDQACTKEPTVSPKESAEMLANGGCNNAVTVTVTPLLQAVTAQLQPIAHPVYSSSSLIKDNIVKPNTEENTGGEEGSGEKRGIAAKDPELFEQYVAMWKRLHKSGFVATSLADPPGRYVVEAWNRAQKDADRRPLLQDIDAIEKAARGAYFAHGQGWFSPDWLLGKKAGQIPNVAKLLRGDLEGRNANGKLSSAELRRQRGHDLSTVTW